MTAKTNPNFPDTSNFSNERLKNYIEAVKDGDNPSIERCSNQLKDYLLEKVDEAIKKFYRQDIDLLNTGMNEMTISGRLAIYLQALFNDFDGYYIDTEYYRLKIEQGKVRDKRKDRIRCDILLHARGKCNARIDNLLAIEIKLEKSDDDGNSDLCRLAEFVIPDGPDTPEGAVHSTLVGLFLRFGEDRCGKVLVTSAGFTDIGKNEITTYKP